MFLNKYTRPLMWGGVGAICATGLFAMVAVLIGGLSDFTLKALITSFVLGYYSLTTSATFGGGGRWELPSTLAGLVLGFLGLVMTLPMIWTTDHLFSDTASKNALTVAALAFGVAHASINARVGGETTVSVVVMFLANLFVLIVTGMVIGMIWYGQYIEDAYIRILIAATIANVTLTLVNPIVARMSRA